MWKNVNLENSVDDNVSDNANFADDNNGVWDKIFRRWTPEDDENFEEPSETSLFLLQNSPPNIDDEEIAENFAAAAIGDSGVVSPPPTTRLVDVSKIFATKISVPFGPTFDDRSAEEIFVDAEDVGWMKTRQDDVVTRNVGKSRFIYRNRSISPPPGLTKIAAISPQKISPPIIYTPKISPPKVLPPDILPPLPLLTPLNSPTDSGHSSATNFSSELDPFFSDFSTPVNFDLPTTEIYLKELKTEKSLFESLADQMCMHLPRILDDEIDRVEERLLEIRRFTKSIRIEPVTDLDLGIKIVDLVFDDTPEAVLRNVREEIAARKNGGKLSANQLNVSVNSSGEISGDEKPKKEYLYERKVNVPVDPEYNFIGRLIGPRGITIKRLEAETGCRLLVRGKGSMKDPVKEEYLLAKKSGYEHLAEDLHILVQADEVDLLKRGVVAVEQMLIPIYENDELKKRQLRELAIINGTCRPPRQAESDKSL